jgi:hypothetical protein
MAKYDLCNYHHDSLGWLECSEDWVSSEFIPELDPGTKYNHCQVDEARTAKALETGSFNAVFEYRCDHCGAVDAVGEPRCEKCDK